MTAAVVAWGLHGIARLRSHGDARPITALAWTMGPLVPACHVVSIGTVLAERLLFLPSVGMMMMLVYVFSRVEARTGRGYGLVVVGLTAVFAVRTVSRNLDWVDSQTLHAADLARHPDSVKLLLSVASDLTDAGQVGPAGVGKNAAAAFAYAQRAQQLVEAEPDVAFNAGSGDFAIAFDHLFRAVLDGVRSPRPSKDALLGVHARSDADEVLGI